MDVFGSTGYLHIFAGSSEATGMIVGAGSSFSGYPASEAWDGDLSGSYGWLTADNPTNDNRTWWIDMGVSNSRKVVGVRIYAQSAYGIDSFSVRQSSVGTINSTAGTLLFRREATGSLLTANNWHLFLFSNANAPVRYTWIHSDTTIGANGGVGMKEIQFLCMR